ASTETICIVNDEPTSLTDAYALMKVLSQGYGEKKVSVLVNNTVTERDALKAYARLERAVERLLHISIDCIGFVPRDAAFCEAVREQTALLQLYPSSSAALALTSLVRRMDQDFQALRVKGGMQFFFKQLVEMNSPGA
ncbi:MAG: flagellar synthesis regulator FleN, partial [Proteobacteria bacterium]